MLIAVRLTVDRNAVVQHARWSACRSTPRSAASTMTASAAAFRHRRPAAVDEPMMMTKITSGGSRSTSRFSRTSIGRSTDLALADPAASTRP